MSAASASAEESGWVLRVTAAHIGELSSTYIVSDSAPWVSLELLQPTHVEPPSEQGTFDVHVAYHPLSGRLVGDRWSERAIAERSWHQRTIGGGQRLESGGQQLFALAIARWEPLRATITVKRSGEALARTSLVIIPARNALAATTLLIVVPCLLSIWLLLLQPIAPLSELSALLVSVPAVFAFVSALGPYFRDSSRKLGAIPLRRFDLAWRVTLPLLVVAAGTFSQLRTVFNQTPVPVHVDGHEIPPGGHLVVWRSASIPPETDPLHLCVKTSTTPSKCGPQPLPRGLYLPRLAFTVQCLRHRQDERAPVPSSGTELINGGRWLSTAPGSCEPARPRAHYPLHQLLPAGVATPAAPGHAWALLQEDASWSDYRVVTVDPGALRGSFSIRSTAPQSDHLQAVTATVGDTTASFIVPYQRKAGIVRLEIRPDIDGAIAGELFCTVTSTGPLHVVGTPWGIMPPARGLSISTRDGTSSRWTNERGEPGLGLWACVPSQPEAPHDVDLHLDAIARVDESCPSVRLPWLPTSGTLTFWRDNVRWGQLGIVRGAELSLLRVEPPAWRPSWVGVELAHRAVVRWTPGADSSLVWLWSVAGEAKKLSSSDDAQVTSTACTLGNTCYVDKVSMPARSPHRVRCAAVPPTSLENLRQAYPQLQTCQAINLCGGD